MEPTRQTLTYAVFVGNDYICNFARVFRQGEYVSGAYYSRAFFCPVCGEVWARMVASGHPFYPFYAHCAKHASAELDGGQLTAHMAVVELKPWFPAEIWNYDLRLMLASNPI